MNGFNRIKINDNILLEEVPNKTRKQFHIKSKMVNETLYDVTSNKYIKDKPSSVISIKSKNLINTMLGVKGVVSITVEKYNIGVSIGKAFDWETDKIQDTIINILNKFMKK